MTIGASTYIFQNNGSGGSGSYIDETEKITATEGQTSITIKANMTTGRVFHVYLNTLQTESVNIQTNPSALSGNVLTISPLLDSGECWVVAYT